MLNIPVIPYYNPGTALVAAFRSAIEARKLEELKAAHALMWLSDLSAQARGAQP